ncbi:MAG: outer membrane beta-barrel protein [Flavobacteriales bacterium]
MKTLRRIYVTVTLFLLCSSAFSQTKPDTAAAEEVTLGKALDLIHHLEDTIRKIQLVVGQMNENLTFTGTRLVGRESSDSLSRLTISGYVSTYFAHYSDSVPIGTYEKFPTVSPYSDAFSLNIAQLSALFISQKSRANLTLQYGDIARSAWSPTFSMLQEANAGIRIVPRLWFDAGLFRTHIGLESIQPRENITSSIAIVTY